MWKNVVRRLENFIMQIMKISSGKISNGWKLASFGSIFLGVAITVILLESFGKVVLTLAITRLVGIALIVGLTLVVVGAAIGGGWSDPAE